MNIEMITMGKNQKDGPLKRLLKSIPGRRSEPEEPEKDQGSSYEFEATIGPKGSGLGITFDKVSQVLAQIKKGMKARVTLERAPGSSIFVARMVFIESEEEKKDTRGDTTGTRS